MPTTSIFGEGLRTARKARGLSLSEVATAAGISTATLSRIETQKQNVDVGMFVEIARVLHVDPRDILGADEAENTEETLAHTLAALPADKRARVISAAAQRRAGYRSSEELNARLDGLLATIELIRDELSALQKQVRRGRR